MAKGISDKINLPPNPSRKLIYTELANHADEIFGKLLYLMHYGDNDNVKLGAARTLANKIAPDLKSSEMTGKDGEKLEGLVIIRAPQDPTK